MTEIDMMHALAHPLPRISAAAFGEAEQRGEFHLHGLLHAMGGQRLDNFAMLITVWNRCSDAERATFVAELLRLQSPAA